MKISSTSFQVNDVSRVFIPVMSLSPESETDTMKTDVDGHRL